MILTSRRQQRVLAAMYSSLRRSDPRLVAKFTIFTRLTKDEAMPPVEHVKRKRLGWLSLTVRGLARRWLRWRLRGLVFISAAAALLAIMILVGQGQARGGCVPAHVSPANATAHQTASSRAQTVGTDCPPGQVFIMARGR
jgi:hypothetical protein